MRSIPIVLAALLLAGCLASPEIGPAPAEVYLPGAGDDECSIPAPLDWLLEDRLPQACCSAHDAAYEAAQLEDAPELERWLADLELETCCVYEAAYGRASPWVCWMSYQGVRLGGWWSWHLEAPDDDRVTDTWED